MDFFCFCFLNGLKCLCLTRTSRTNGKSSFQCLILLIKGKKLSKPTQYKPTSTAAVSKVFPFKSFWQRILDFKLFRWFYKLFRLMASSSFFSKVIDISELTDIIRLMKWEFICSVSCSDSLSTSGKLLLSSSSRVGL